MNWVIGVTYNSERVDPIGMNRKSDLKDLGLSVDQVKTMHVYYIEGSVEEAQIRKACDELLADSVIQTCRYAKESDSLGLVEDKKAWLVEVRNKQGVTDAVGESTLEGMRVLGIDVEKVETAFTYAIEGDLSESDVKEACEKSLANSLIQDYKYVRA